MTSHDDIMLIGALDQPIQTDDDWVFSRIDEIIQESVEKHDALIALNVCKQLYGISKTSGLALAKALYLTKQNWEVYNVGDEFTNTVLSEVGLHEHTIDRYINIWGMFAENKIPDEIKDEIQQRNIKDLVPIANALAQGYVFTEKQWEKLADASDFSEVNHIVQQEIKNKEPRKNALQIYIDRSGSLWAFQDRERYFVGSLEVTDDHEAVQKAINRIVSSSGVIKQ